MKRCFLQSSVGIQLMKHVGLFVVIGCENNVNHDILDDLNYHEFR